MTWGISIDVPAGNLIVGRIEKDHARIRQDQRGSTQRWFYWRFAVRGAAGRTIRFEFTDWDVIGTRGPAVSRDGGRSWNWLGRECCGPNSFTHTFGANDSDVQFCFCLPYLQWNLDMFLARRGDGIQRDVLCRSRAGREVEMLIIGPPDAKHRVILTARHHACESSASFVLEGLLDAVAHAAPDTPQDWLRQNALVVAMPFVDKDGVEAGDQGKARDGHDHNRDYIPAPVYPETAAIMRLVRDGFRPDVAIDLHSPWIRGPHNECIYQVGCPNNADWEAQQRFARVLELQPATALPYSHEDDLPWGKEWNTEPATETACTCRKWMAAHATLLSTSFEIPYANVGDVTVTPDNLREFGGRLAAAIGAFLQTPE